MYHLFFFPILSCLFIFSIKKRIHPVISHIFILNDLLCTSDKQTAFRYQWLAELRKHFFFRFFRKIDQHISAYDHMTVRRILILQQIMLLKFHTILDFLCNLIRSSNLCEKTSFQISRNSCNALFCIQSNLCLFNHLLINIRCYNMDMGKR